MDNKNYLQLLLGVSTLFLISCQNSTLDLKQLEKGARETLLCEQNFDQFNNSIYNFWLNKNHVPDEKEFRQQLEKGLQEDPLWAKTPLEIQSRAVEFATQYYQFLTLELTANAESPEDKLKLLTALEIGDQEDSNESLQIEWSQQKKRFLSDLHSLRLPCDEVNLRTERIKMKEDSLYVDQFPLKTKLPRSVEGLRWAFATAYQSCHAIEVHALSEQTPDLEGIRILPKGHPDGVGRKRVYGDVHKILASHPYYGAKPVEKGCFDSRKKPLIYDYGGKPHTTSADNAILDFFTNEGSGTSALGIDCSGFIFSALARGGIKLDPAKPIKAVSVYGVSAKMFKNPQKNGLACFNRLTAQKSSSLQAGDIIASDGHVVMVDQIGEDPLGLRRANNLADCNAEILNSEGFDFIITHSSPWKEGVGINRSVIRDYLRDSETFRTGLVNYAVAFCKAKFTTKNPSPITSSEISIIRHRGTADCLSAKAIGLKHETCVQRCPLDNPIPNPL